jgi:CTP synthase (UTP-ammonia lyase)
VEYARNVIGIEDADHEENNPEASRRLISKLSCSLVGTSERIELQEGSLAHQVYGQRYPVEGYRCNYSLNPEYEKRLSQGGLKFVGRNASGAVRLVELEGHRFFMASLFLPQMTSAADNPHPMIVRYLEEASRSEEFR